MGPAWLLFGSSGGCERASRLSKTHRCLNVGRRGKRWGRGGEKEGKRKGLWKGEGNGIRWRQTKGKRGDKDECDGIVVMGGQPEEGPQDLRCAPADGLRKLSLCLTRFPQPHHREVRTA